jgi:hypothetical protein
MTSPHEYEHDAVADGQQVTCAVFDESFIDHDVVNDTAVLEGVLENVAEQYGLSYDNAMDVVNEQGYDYCDRHWDNLVDVGRTARAEITAHGA